MRPFKVPKQFRLDRKLVRRAAALLKRDPDRWGDFSGVWFLEDLAIKSPLRDNSGKITPGTYLRELYMAQDLVAHGVNVPRAHGLHIPFFASKPYFMVQDRIDGVEPQEADIALDRLPIPFEKVVREYRAQKSKAEVAGYRVHGDCGINIKGSNNLIVSHSGRVYLFDVDSWGAPERIDRRLYAGV